MTRRRTTQRNQQDDDEDTPRALVVKCAECGEFAEDIAIPCELTDGIAALSQAEMDNPGCGACSGALVVDLKR